MDEVESDKWEKENWSIVKFYIPIQKYHVPLESCGS